MAVKKRGTKGKEPWELIKEARNIVIDDKIGSGNPVELAPTDLSEGLIHGRNLHH